MTFNVIKRSNMPVSFSIWGFVASRMALEHWHLGPSWYVAWWWYWGINIALIALLGLRTEVDLLKPHK